MKKKLKLVGMLGRKILLVAVFSLFLSGAGTAFGKEPVTIVFWHAHGGGTR